MTPTLVCAACGVTLPPIKNWTRLSVWRRERPRRCHQCASTKHGLSRTRLHKEWSAMRVRCGLLKCSNPDALKYYIARGISVCEAWANFTAFAEWALANGYRDDLSLDRIDNDRGYSPSNCRWVTMTEQLRNRRDRKLTAEMAAAIRAALAIGASRGALAERYGVSPHHIYQVGRGARWAA